jgi:lycopene cyclase domain-containing protein
VTYTQLAALAAVAVVGVDTLLLRTRLLRRRLYWTAYGIVLGFQLVTNGILTGRRVVRYEPHAILGPRLVYAPVEDLLFGFAMVTLTLSSWVWLGRRGWPGRQAGRAGDRRRAAPARTRPGTATAARRTGPTDTRRSSTR